MYSLNICVNMELACLFKPNWKKVKQLRFTGTNNEPLHTWGEVKLEKNKRIICFCWHGNDSKFPTGRIKNDFSWLTKVNKTICRWILLAKLPDLKLRGTCVESNFPLLGRSIRYRAWNCWLLKWRWIKR